MRAARDPELLWLAGLAVALGAFLWWRGAEPEADAPAEAPEDRPPTVLFVVLDTVRADHASTCGYERPTTPTLDALVEGGASIACDVVAPGSWTLPSHASFFTGEPVEAHGAHFVPRDSANLLGAMEVRPLDKATPTLAEDFRARGYTALSLSGNPVIGRATGLVRGFHRWRAGRRFGEIYGRTFTDELGVMLDGHAPVDKPLFLFLNIADAHQPWGRVPSSAGWVPAQPATHPHMEDVFQQKWSPREVRAHMGTVRNAYDWGVFRASRTLDAALTLLEERGWADTGMRIVITSDHGEFLGEHRLVDHGRYLWEPNQRVFLLHDWRGPGRPADEARTLPSGLSGLAAWHLARDGRLPAVQGPVTAVAYPDAYWQELSGGRLGTSTSAAIWAGDEKLVWQDGVATLYDIGDDPGELAGLPLPDDHALHAALDGLVQRVEESAGAPVDLDPELVEQLKAAGYMADDDE